MNSYPMTNDTAMKHTFTLIALLLAPWSALPAAEPEPIANSPGMKLVRIAPESFLMGQDGPAADYNVKKQ